MGRGKGLAVYVKEELTVLDTVNIAEPNIQLSKIVMKQLDLITVYRSHSMPFLRAAHLLQSLVSPLKDTLIVGDVNYCAKKEENHLSIYLQEAGFNQHVTLPTHLKGGTFNNLSVLKGALAIIMPFQVFWIKLTFGEIRQKCL